MVKNLAANAGDTEDVGLIPRSKRYPRGVNGNLLQYSGLGNSVDRGACQAIVHWVAKSQTQLSGCTHIHTHTHSSCTELHNTGYEEGGLEII